jgi:hypothetical protein
LRFTASFAVRLSTANQGVKLDPGQNSAVIGHRYRELKIWISGGFG